MLSVAVAARYPYVAPPWFAGIASMSRGASCEYDEQGEAEDESHRDGEQNAGPMRAEPESARHAIIGTKLVGNSAVRATHPAGLSERFVNDKVVVQGCFVGGSLRE